VSKTGLYRISLALAVSAMSVLDLATAAEISRGSGGTVVLEGRIEPGDYNKLRDDLVAHREYGIDLPYCFSATYEEGCPEAIYLASPGGDVAEAMKIGRLVRALGWKTMAPITRERDNEIKWYSLLDPKSNFMCASACFFIFVAGIDRDQYGLGTPLLGIHWPYLPPDRLREITGSQAIASAQSIRTTVESYLKEMNVPTRYSDQMFSVPKEKILWISDDSYDDDFSGFVPSLRDWVDAKCDDRSDIEKSFWESIKDKPGNDLTPTERSMSDMLMKKMQLQQPCKNMALFELRKEAWQRWRKETLQNIAAICTAPKNNLPNELAVALSNAKPNQHTTSDAISLAQTAALCGDYASRENAIRALAERGDAKAQRILGNLYLFGGSAIAKDKVEGMKWYGRAGAQGDVLAQNFYREYLDAASNPNHVWTTKDDEAVGRWIGQNCPALC
jgi:hypothetical protein